MDDVNELIKITKKYLTKYDYEKVQHYCDRILEIESISHFGLQFKAISLSKTGDIPGALKYYKKLHQFYPDDLDVVYSIGYLNEKLGKYDKASEYYDIIQRDTYVENKRKYLLSKMHNHDNLISVCDDKLKDLDWNYKSSKLPLLEQKAIFSYRKGEYDKAYELFKEVSELNYIPANSIGNLYMTGPWFSYLSDLLEKYSDSNEFFQEFFKAEDENTPWIRRTKGALSSFNNLLYADILTELNPNNIELINAFASDIKHVDTDYALDYYHKVLELDSENEEAIFSIIDIYINDFLKDKALDFIDSKLHIKRLKGRLLENKINILESMTLYEDALKTYDEYIKEFKNPSNKDRISIYKIRALERYMIELCQEKNYEKAFEILKEASELVESIDENVEFKYPEDTDLSKYWRFNNTWFKQILCQNIKDYDEAGVFFDNFFNLTRDNVSIWLDKLDNHKLSEKYLELLNNVDDYAQMWYLKAKIFEDKKDYEQTLNCYNKALSIKPDWEYVANLKVDLLIKLNRLDEACELLNDVNHDFDFFYERIANKYFDNKQYDKAYEYYKKSRVNHGNILKIRKIFNTSPKYQADKEKCKYINNWIDSILKIAKTNKCPYCGNKLTPIVYGLPASDFDYDKYVSGGCVVSEGDPQHYCRSCDKEIYFGVNGILIDSNDLGIYHYTRKIVSSITNSFVQYDKYSGRIRRNKSVNLEDLKDKLMNEYLLDEAEFDRLITKLVDIKVLEVKDDEIKLLYKKAIRNKRGYGRYVFD